jgi:hypothetical protein
MALKSVQYGGDRRSSTYTNAITKISTRYRDTCEHQPAAPEDISGAGGMDLYPDEYEHTPTGRKYLLYI